MKRLRCLPLALVLILVLPAAADAACETTWNGGVGDYQTATNWSNGVPVGAKGGCVPSGTVVVTSPSEAEALDIGDGAGEPAVVRLIGGEEHAMLRLYKGGTIHEDGTLALVAGGPGVSVVSTDTPNVLTNNGTLRTAPGRSGPVQIFTRLVNNGTLDVNESVEGQSDWTNRGTIDIEPGKRLLYTGTGAGPSFRLEGGTIAVSGTFLQTNGSFVHVGPATVTGFVQFVNTKLNASGQGEAMYVLAPVAGIGAGSDLSGDIGADKIIVLRNNTAAPYSAYIRPDPIVNRGTVILDGSGQVDVGHYAGLDNRGRLEVRGTGLRQFNKPLRNLQGGTIDLIGHGLRAADGFVQQAGATLDLDVNSDGGTSVLSVVGEAALGGALKVTTGGPASGSHRIIEASTRTGTFASTKFMGAEWSVGYDATGATLALDATPPALALSGRRSQKLGKRVAIAVRADEACKAVVTGRLTAGRRSFKLGRASTTIDAGGKETLKPKLPKRARRAARKALAKGKKARARLTAVCTDARGNAAKKRRSVKLTR